MTRAERRRAERKRKSQAKRKPITAYGCPHCGEWFDTLEDLIDHQDLQGHVIPLK